MKSKRTPKKLALKKIIPIGYTELLNELKTRIQNARLHATLAVNRELVLLYWDIGRVILERQNKEGWGAKVIEQVAMDLHREFPDMKGLSRANLFYMRAFAEAYTNREFVQQLAGQLPWFHNVVILTKLKKPEEREWYIRMCIENGWSRNTLEIQIENNLYGRQGKAITNFGKIFPAPKSDLIQQITKDPYVFDFLSIREDYNEHALEEELTSHVQKFLLELGAGFAFVGRQVHLEVGGEDFYIDLLFYHLKLRCFIVVDLKTGAFIPEYAGKMNFYLSAVDDLLKHPSDEPSIGIILCKSKNRIIAEYALRDIAKPVGVSGYITKIVESLPEQLREILPSPEVLGEELSRTQLEKKDE